MEQTATPTNRRAIVVRVVAASLSAVVVGLLLHDVVYPPPGDPPGAALAASVEQLLGDPPVRDLEPYRGHGAWVDAFDYLPAYTEGEPALGIDALDDMQAAGVRTVFLQAARDDERAEGLIADAETVGLWLVEAHRHDMDVVAWYLPSLVDVDDDLAHLNALREFDVLGHGFDGVAVDIEAREVSDHVVRSSQLVELSRRFRDQTGDEVLGAIVLPPVLLEVVNPQFWPQFPWRDLEPLYDVWLPMAYWSQRTTDSGYHDGFTYLEESTRRMRANLGTDDAVVHGIGGIGNDLTDDEIEAFALALAEIGAIGGSIYDWDTLPETQEALVDEAVDRATGT